MGSTIFIVQSDSAAISLPAPVGVTAGYISSTEVSVRNYSEVDWIIEFTNKASITRLDIQWEWTDDVALTSWTPLNTETVSSGVSTISTYEVQQTIGAGDIVNFRKGWTTPVKGLYMRMKIKAGVGDPSGSALAAKALRRV